MCISLSIIITPCQRIPIGYSRVQPFHREVLQDNHTIRQRFKDEIVVHLSTKPHRHFSLSALWTIKVGGVGTQNLIVCSANVNVFVHIRNQEISNLNHSQINENNFLRHRS